MSVNLKQLKDQIEQMSKHWEDMNNINKDLNKDTDPQILCNTIEDLRDQQVLYQHHYQLMQTNTKQTEYIRELFVQCDSQLNKMEDILGKILAKQLLHSQSKDKTSSKEDKSKGDNSAHIANSASDMSMIILIMTVLRRHLSLTEGNPLRTNKKKRQKEINFSHRPERIFS